MYNISYAWILPYVQRPKTWQGTEYVHHTRDLANSFWRNNAISRFIIWSKLIATVFWRWWNLPVTHIYKVFASKVLYRKWVTSQYMFSTLPYMLLTAIFQLQEQYQDHNNWTSTNKNIISEWYTHFLIVWARLSLLGGTVSVDGGRWCSEPVGVCPALPPSVWALCLETQRVISSLEIQKDKDKKLYFFRPQSPRGDST